MNSGLSVTNSYDVVDRTTNVVYRNSTGTVLASFTFAYNNAGMITQKIALVNAQATTNIFGYDYLDRLISDTLVGSNAYAQQYSYDKVGNRTVKTNGSAVVSYAYSNGNNRLLYWSATSTNNFAALAKVDVAGYLNESIVTNPALGQKYVSNSVATTVPAVSGNTNFSATNFSFAPGSQSLIAAIADTAGNVGYATNTVTMQIVTNGQYLTNAAGCVIQIMNLGTGGYSNRLNLTFNSQYQVTAVSSNDVEAERYGYDVLGRRAYTAQGGTTSFHVYAGVQVIADLNNTGAVLRTYTWGPGIDNLLAMTVYGGTGSTPSVYYPLTDHLGTVHALANSNGVIVESYTYDAWGRVLSVRDSNNQELITSSIGNRFLWQGREYSWASGLYNFRARWYDPITGRWLSNDPIGISGGLNQYVFCNNNPVNFRDPTGLAPGDKYTTIAAAAAVALQDINPTSISEDREYGGYIFENSDGTYSYERPRRGGESGILLIPIRLGRRPIVAGYHTHGYDPPGCDEGETFSLDDMNTSRLFNWPEYLGTPDGSIKEFIPFPGPGKIREMGRTPLK